MGADLKGRKVKPGSKNPEKLDFQYKANEAIAEGDILCIVGVEGQWFKMEKADADVAAEARGPLFFATTACAANGMGRCRAFGTLTEVNTNGATIGDPVYLSTTPGGFSLSAGGSAVQRRVGIVAKVSATLGEILFNGFAYPSSRPFIAGIATVLTGQTSVTVSAATLGGSYGGKPVVATLNEQDGTKAVANARWSTNDLIIELTAATVGADRDVSYIVALD